LALQHGCVPACFTHVALCLQASNVTLRIELPPLNGGDGPVSLVVIRLEKLGYAGMGRCLDQTNYLLCVTNMRGAALVSQWQ
jgi:hypothetical protein